MKKIKRLIEKISYKIGKKILDKISGLGRFTKFISLSLKWTFKRPFRVKLGWEQIYFIGNKSIFIVCLTGLFTGMVMALQVYEGFKIISADSLIGPVVAISLAKELAPALTGLIVAGRCGAAMAAQIGSMKVTEQLDALEVMGISSHQYLAVPRIVAALFAMPMLSCIYLLVGCIGSHFVGISILEIDEVVYYSQLGNIVKISHIIEGMIKAVIFGFVIACIGTYQGFAVRGGAEGVGRATNMAVVWGMVVVLVLDYFLTSIIVAVM